MYLHEQAVWEHMCLNTRILPVSYTLYLGEKEKKKKKGQNNSQKHIGFTQLWWVD